MSKTNSKFMRVISIMLIITFLISTITTLPSSAADIKDVRGTILNPILPWYKAYEDGLPVWNKGYFHKLVQNYIWDNYPQIEKEELSISGGSENGKQRLLCYDNGCNVKTFQLVPRA